MIVVDLGCETHGNEESIRRLVERFHPELLLGFDPLSEPAVLRVDGSIVVKVCAAAGVEDGVTHVGIGDGGGMNTTVMRDKYGSGEWNVTMIARCFDFARFLATVPEPIIVKMDIEGAEYAILEKIVADGTDDRMSLLLVEWHDHMMEDPAAYEQRRLALYEDLRCPVEGW